MTRFPGAPRGSYVNEPVQLLIDHQRLDAGSCLCGWSQWGASHAEHVWRVLRLHGARMGGDNPIDGSETVAP